MDVYERYSGSCIYRIHFLVNADQASEDKLQNEDFKYTVVEWQVNGPLVPMKILENLLDRLNIKLVILDTHPQYRFIEPSNLKRKNP